MLVFAMAPPAAAQQIPCGEPYTVRRGDTLQRIAERAYGPEASFRDLIEDNLQYFIGGDPSRIAIGQTLTIPCPQESDPQSQAEATTGQEPMPRSVQAGPALLTVARSDGTDAAERVAALAESTGIAAADDARTPVDIADLIVLLSTTQRPLIADALPRPDCDTAGVEPLAQDLCSQLAWSAPVAEYVLSTFTLSEAGPVTLNESLRGQDLCLPMPLPIYLLAGRGLLPPTTQIQQPADVTACFTALRTGSVDAVIAPAMLADEAMAALGPGANISEQFALAQLVTLHSAALAGDGAAVEALALLGEALISAQHAASGPLGRLPD